MFLSGVGLQWISLICGLPRPGAHPGGRSIHPGSTVGDGVFAVPQVTGQQPLGFELLMRYSEINRGKPP